MKKIRVGSRDSQLAIAQSKIIINEIQRHFPEAKLELVTMKTTGDLILDRRLDNEGGKGLFTRELDRALLDHRVDLAVHSLKDMPAQLDSSLAISAYCAEEDPRDALVLPAGAHNIQCEKPIGCAGRRRPGSIRPIA